MKKLMLLTVALASGLACFAAENAAPAVDFQAGFHAIDITPPLGTPISGYYSRRAASGVLDNLHARCLALSDGSTRALVYSVDNLHIIDDVIAEVKAAITAKTRIPADHIFIACTHTHTGAATAAKNTANTIPADEPVIRFANQFLATRCADAAVLALADLAPAEIRVGRSEAKGISFVRRFRMKDGSTRTNPGVRNPDIAEVLGQPDEQLQLVRFVRADRKDIALINFQTHPDVIGGTKFSGDWPALACTYLEKALGGEAVAMLVNGAQGDTNHININPDPLLKNTNKGYEQAHRMAQVVAGGALAAWGFCHPVPAGKVRAGMPGITVALNKAKPEELPEARRIVALHKANRAGEIPGTGMQRTSNIAGAYRMLELENKPAEIDMPVSVVAVGTALVFGGFPGEPFTWMGTEMKAKSPFAMTIPACCVNGSRGYFPVRSAYGPGGYENSTSRFKPGTAERLVDGILGQITAFHAAAQKD